MLTRSDLHAYQNDAIEHIKTEKKCALFIGMGLGKSIITLTAINDLIKDGKITKVLLIAPPKVANSVWQQEVEKWTHTKELRVVLCLGTIKVRNKNLKRQGDIYIITPDSVKWFVTNYKDEVKFDALVIDESTKFKNPFSERFLNLKKIIDSFSYVVLLTGTPTPNSYIDIWSQIYLLDKGNALGKNIHKFREMFFSIYKGDNFSVYKIKDSSKKVIDNKIKHLCISMRSCDYLSLPDVININRFVYFDKKVRSFYEKFKETLSLTVDGKAINAVNAATLCCKLMQFSNGFLYNDGSHVKIHTEKIDELNEIIQEEDRPVIVVYYFKKDLSVLLEHVSGSEMLTNDNDVINRWNSGKIKVLLMSSASSAHGLNLQYGGSTIIWFGVPFSLENYEQMNARLHRQGQKNTVKLVHILAKDSIDEYIIEVLNKKSNSQNQLLDFLNKELKR